ncbi:MAG: DUF2244 domain-containing protein, partial [Pseudoruegeria sp.]
MPIEWHINPDGAPEHSGALSYGHASGVPYARVTLWPHQSLTPFGFVLFIGITAGLFLMPLLAVLGSPILWALLPFLLFTIMGVWYAIRRNQKDAQKTEVLTLWSDKITLHHTAGRTPTQTWEANPYWISTEIIPTGGPVPNYLILKGGPRTVELGAFLSEEERP